MNIPYSSWKSYVLAAVEKSDCKAIIMSRFGMLECGMNFKGTLGNHCEVRDNVDDEEHRLNHCERFIEFNSH